MRKFTTFFTYAFLIIVSLLSIFPLYWMAVSATNTSVEIIRGKLVPGTYLLENLKNLTASQDVIKALSNSFKYAVATTIISILVCSIAGYGFEIYHSKGKDMVMSVLLLAMMVPFAAVMIPLFKMFSQMGLLNSTVGFFLPTIATPFLIMMFRQSARSFPGEIIEAARIDGLSEFSIFWRMFIPTMRSTYAAAVTITFMGTWNSYLWPKVIMQDNSSQTMPMLVANIIGGYVTDYGILMLAVLISTIPTIVVFFLLQKSFAEGITGAVK